MSGQGNSDKLFWGPNPQSNELQVCLKGSVITLHETLLQTAIKAGAKLVLTPIARPDDFRSVRLPVFSMTRDSQLSFYALSELHLNICRGPVLDLTKVDHRDSLFNLITDTFKAFNGPNREQPQRAFMKKSLSLFSLTKEMKNLCLDTEEKCDVLWKGKIRRDYSRALYQDNDNVYCKLVVTDRMKREKAVYMKSQAKSKKIRIMRRREERLRRRNGQVNPAPAGPVQFPPLQRGGLGQAARNRRIFSQNNANGGNILLDPSRNRLNAVNHNSAETSSSSQDSSAEVQSSANALPCIPRNRNDARSVQ